MKGRHSQNPVDKVFGLTALLECKVVLAYSENEQEEHAWARLLRHVSSRILAQLLFACPLPGENGCYWRPSWNQLMVGTGVVKKMPSLHLVWSVINGVGNLACRIALIKECQVSLDSSVNTVVIKTERQGKKYKWRMINLNPHTQDIVPGKLYTLAGCYHFGLSLHYDWVLCKPYGSGGSGGGLNGPMELEKVSVLRRLADEIRGSDLIGIGLDGLLTRAGSDLMYYADVVFR